MQITHVTVLEWTSVATQQYIGLLLALPLLMTFALQSFYSWRRSSDAKSPERALADRIGKAKDFAEICSVFGYVHEEHSVTTEDGYILLLHRIVSGSDSTDTSAQSGAPGKPVVFINHGLLTNSELYMAVPDPRKCLPLVLVNAGYDVWLGNNRGNKYSKNHTTKEAGSPEFWDFCIDDFARYDVPNSIDFVLDYTDATSLRYVGFSQGTAQAFGALSIHPELNRKISTFIALAPILHPPGYASRLLDYIIKKNPSIIFKFFGRKSMIPSVAFWQTTLPTIVLHAAMDFALIFLLGFQNHNISSVQKRASYTHIYCSSSVKTVVHWAQIMRDTTFGFYQPIETAQSDASLMPKYATQSIKAPMVLIYGSRDKLVAINTMRERLPPGTRYHELPNYEHIDVLWGNNVENDVIPHVLSALNSSLKA